MAQMKAVIRNAQLGSSDFYVLGSALHMVPLQTLTYSDLCTHRHTHTHTQTHTSRDISQHTAMCPCVCWPVAGGFNRADVQKAVVISNCSPTISNLVSPIIHLSLPFLCYNQLHCNTIYTTVCPSVCLSAYLAVLEETAATHTVSTLYQENLDPSEAEISPEL